VLIRPETEADFPAIRRINVEAFADHPYSRHTEHRIVDALRAAGALALSLVAEIGGETAGHIAFSAAAIDGADRGWLLLGPLAVLPGLQRRGVGTALVRAGLAELRLRHARGCVLVGDPAYYTRLGFRQAIGLRYPGVPDEFVLTLPLAGEEPAGRVEHHPAFDVPPEPSPSGLP
jgi:putative acetyltransferase